MNLSAFKESLAANNPPSASVYIRSLWYDAKNDWNTAHELVDSLEDKKAYWVHGYLHRKEGDISNADYWYSRAGKIRPSISLTEEWEQLVKAFAEEKNSL